MTPRVWLVLFALVAVGGSYCAGQSQGRDAERSRVIAARVDTLTVTVRTRDTIFRTIDRARVKYDTVWQVVRARDTVVVMQHDTAVVYVPRAVADSTINLCRLTLSSCTARVASRDTLIGALREQVKAERDRHPSFISVWAWRLGFLGLGYAIAK